MHERVKHFPLRYVTWCMWSVTCVCCAASCTDCEMPSSTELRQARAALLQPLSADVVLYLCCADVYRRDLVRVMV
jgi:hypothetical protein